MEKHTILAAMAGACLAGAILIIMHDRPLWQRVAVFVLLVVAISCLAAVMVLAGQGAA